MADAPTVALTGATGNVGGLVAARLAERGLAQRLVVRDPSRAPSLAGAEVAQASYDDPAEMRAALSGVETLCLVSAPEAQVRVDRHRRAVDAAVDAGVERIVYLSFVRATPESTFTFARDHAATETYVRGSGVRFTFLRPNLYLDLLPHLVGEDGVIRGPAGEGRFTPVARTDLADVVAAVLATEGHDGRTYDVTGSASMMMKHVAAELARATGRPISYHDETPDEARASRARYGTPEWEVEGWVSSYLAIARGELDAFSRTVSRATGRTPLTFAEFLDRHPESYLHLL